MYEKKIPKSFDCGMSVLMEIIGGKWKTYMIFLINNGKRRPSELQKAIPDANRRVLDLQLRELEFFSIIRRVIYPEAPPRVEYYLTDFGKTLIPVIEAMDQWGDGFVNTFEQMMKQKKQALHEPLEQL